MKISKLFHWLYALLMLLPIFAVGVSCLYVTFNKNAFQSYSSVYKESYINVDIGSAQIGETYYIITPSTYSFSRQTDFTEISVQDVFFDNVSKDVNKLRIYVPTNSIVLYIQAIGNEGFTFTSDVSHILSFNYFGVSNEYYVSQINEILFKQDVVSTSYLSDVFYNSLYKVQNSSLFNWAYNLDLLGVPVSYIGGIFGLASNSIFNVLLCYWVAISIIWLVFDVLMFVPLLVHKSIDKMRF